MSRLLWFCLTSPCTPLLECLAILIHLCRFSEGEAAHVYNSSP